MVVYLPQLHAFLNEISARLPPDDLYEITTGIAYIIQPMQPAEGINALSLFAHPILEQVVRLSTSPQLESGQIRIMAGTYHSADSLFQLKSHSKNRCTGTLMHHVGHLYGVF